MSSLYSALIKPFRNSDANCMSNRETLKNKLQEIFPEATRIQIEPDSTCLTAYIFGDEGKSVMLSVNDYNGWYVDQYYGDNPPANSRRLRNNGSISLYHSDNNVTDTLFDGIGELVEGGDFAAQLDALISKVRDTYRKPTTPGCVKAYLCFSHLAWFNKRANNPEVTEHNGKHYWTKDSYLWVKVFTNEDRTESRWVYRYDPDIGSIARRHNGVYYDVSLFVPVYAAFNEDTREGIGGIVAYSLAGQAALRFRSYEGNEGTVFTSEPVPYSDYNSKGVWNYTKRIEELLPASDLFRTGKLDLYRNRPVEETPFLGWELEACCNKSTAGAEPTAIAMRQALDKSIICKQDGSIQPAGFETVSIPGTLDFWKEQPIADAMNKLRSAPYNMRSYEHHSCGFHVHVSRSALSVLDLQKLERFMHNPANRDFLSAVAGRGSNSYAAYNDNFFSNRKGINAGRRSSRNTDSSRPSLSPDQIGPGIWADYRTSYTNKWRCLVLFIYNYFSLRDMCRFGHAEGTDLEQNGYWAIRYIYTGSDATADSYRHSLKAFLEFYVSRKNDNAAKMIRRACAELMPDEQFNFVEAPSEASSGPQSWKAGLRKTKHSFKRTANHEVSQSIEGPVGKGAERYDVLNTKNKATVEFRLFKGTMNPDSIYRYLEFVDALVRFVPTTSACDDGVNFSKFIDWLKNDSFNRLRYENLLAFLIKKEYIKRKDIRRREVKDVEERDNIIDGQYLATPSATQVTEDEMDELDMMDDDEMDELDCDCPDCRPDLYDEETGDYIG